MLHLKSYTDTELKFYTKKLIECFGENRVSLSYKEVSSIISENEVRWLSNETDKAEIRDLKIIIEANTLGYIYKMRDLKLVNYTQAVNLDNMSINNEFYNFINE